MTTLEADSPLLVHRHEAVSTLTLNRPARRNALTRQLLVDLGRELLGAREDAGVRALVLTGAGSAFCSGADLDDARRPTGPSEPTLPSLLHGIARTMRALDKPVIAAMNGAAVGAGLALGLMTDIRIVAEDAQLSEGYIRIGLFAGAGDTYLLPRLIGTGHALRMLWTGEPISGMDAQQLGLAQQAVAREAVLTTAVDLAERIAASRRSVVGYTKQAVYEMQALSLDRALDLSAEYSALTGQGSGGAD
jgi:2-(1,2-epoxy-1,2-dihydrophenyl)acetyl-CoA isomerase